MHSIHWIYGSQRGFQCSAMTRFMFGPPCSEYICANGVEYIPGKSKLQNKQTKFKRTRPKRSLKIGLDELLDWRKLNLGQIYTFAIKKSEIGIFDFCLRRLCLNACMIFHGHMFPLLRDKIILA